MTTFYGDFQGTASADVTAYPISYSQDGSPLNGIGIFNVSPLAQDMIDLLPSYYCLGNNNRRIMELIAVILSQYDDNIADLQAQFFAKTATWGLKYWEQFLGIPTNENLSDDVRRAAICNKLNDCSSEKCFVEGLEAVVNGKVIVTLLPPTTNPYQINIELRSAEVVYQGPISYPVALASGTGPLDGDYTYKVTYEFEPMIIPNYIMINPLQGAFGETSSGVAPIKTNEIQVIGASEQQTLGISGDGTFRLTFDGDETVAALTELSTGTDVVNALNSLSPTVLNTFGPFSVSTPTPNEIVSTDEQQVLKITGNGAFEITFDGAETAVLLNENSTGADVAAAINTLSPATTYGAFSVEAVDPLALVKGSEGVRILFNGGGVAGVGVTPMQITSATGTIGGSIEEDTGDGVVILFNQNGVQFQDVNTLAVTSTTGSIVGTTVEIKPGNAVTGGTFTITYNSMWDQGFPVVNETTEPIPWNATRKDVSDALYALSSIYPGTLKLSGGPLPLFPITIEFEGYEAGFPQAMFAINSDDLTPAGAFYGSVRTQAGGTVYGDSESNTVRATNNIVTLTNIPKSPDGALKRNIYRKKYAAPYDEYRLVGTIDDNVTTIFVDNVPDTDLSETQTVQVDGSGNTLRLRFDSVDTIDLTQASSASAVEAALESLVTLTYPTVGVTVSGTNLQTGLTIKFDGGDVAGKDVPQLEVIDVNNVGLSSTVTTDTGGRNTNGNLIIGSVLTEQNTAFTYTFQRAIDYIYVTKPAHLRIRELRSAAFRASISRAGEPV